MLTTNLSTRPFYNELAVRTAVGIVLLLVLLLTAFSVFRALSLRAEEQRLSARATQARSEAARLRAEADRAMAQIDPKELESVSTAASEANDAITRRTFSWTALLADLEVALPANVRVTAVAPRLENGIIKVVFQVESTNHEELAEFMDALDARGSFLQVLPGGQSMFDDVINASIEAIYQPRRTGPEAVTNTGGKGGGERGDGE